MLVMRKEGSVLYKTQETHFSAQVSKFNFTPFSCVREPQSDLGLRCPLTFSSDDVELNDNYIYINRD